MEVIKKECEHCGKRIEATSETQAIYLILQHKLAKHRDKLEIKEKK